MERSNEIMIRSELTNSIEDKIFTIRGKQVMIDRDLAEIYEVATKVLNQSVKRNIERFPEHFRFQLTEEEFQRLVTICDRFTVLKHSSRLPYVFTEQGVAMLASVLRSDIAISVSIKIMDAFVSLRKFIISNAQLFQRLETLEYKQIETSNKIEQIFNKIGNGAIPTQGIFYDGQVFDAYVFISQLIKSSKREIILIDNYIDETVFTLLDKRNENVAARIYTKQITKQLQLDIDKHNTQYKTITVKLLDKSHDRFLIIDDSIYHIGASIKDLGKKWFAFTLMKGAIIQEFIAKLN